VVAHLCLCPGGAKAPKSDDDELVQRFSTPWRHGKLGQGERSAWLLWDMI
jgi:hypothetical protein